MRNAAIGVGDGAWYSARMEGATPWGLILAMFAYAFAGWSVLFAIHYLLRRRRIAPQNARHAAMGYGESWKSSRVSDF